VIKIKKIFFLVLFLLINIEKTNAEISDSLFMTIGNKAITQSDLVDEIKIILILNNESYSDEKKDILHELAVKSTIKRTIKKIELERNNYFRFNDEVLKMELAKLASNIFLDLNTLKNICESNELNFAKIEDQVKIELSWNNLIFEIYKHNLSINQTEIEDRLKLIQNKKKLEEYLISEIVIKNVETNKLDSEIQRLKDKIKIDGFENVAKELSISESRMKGGDLGWISENIISEKIKSKLMETPIGKLSLPIILQDGILIFKVRDKRKIDKNVSLEEIKNELINAEKSKILNMHSISHYDKARRSISIKLFQ
jgi:peptidyl-prolyl cis-trans isomerase SurA